MGLDQAMVPVLAVALITWAGLFFYLLRLDRVSRDLEARARDLPRPDEGPAEIEGSYAAEKLPAK